MLYNHETTSWIIIEKATGKAVLETWLESVAEKVNTEKYAAIPSHEYLFNLNTQQTGDINQ